MKKIILFLLALALTIGADAQRGNGVRRASSIDDFVAKSITTADGVLPYREALINVGAEGKPTLVLYMHSANGRGSDNTRQMRQQAVYAICDYMQQHGIKGYLLVPQCPEDRYWPGNRDYEAYTEPVKQLISLYMTEFDIDPARVYVFGASMGGAGTWRLIGELSGTFSAALIASGNYWGSDYVAVCGTPVYMTVGGAEGDTRVGQFRQLYEDLFAMGADVRFDILADLEHGATCEQSFTEERIAWVFSHQGNASGIRAVLREPKAETFVTLSGIRTNVPRRGVVTHNGRKMIHK